MYPQSVSHRLSPPPPSPSPPPNSSGQTYVVTVRSNPDTNAVPMLTNVTLSCRIQPLPSTYHYYEWTSGSNGFYSSRYANLSTIDIPWFRPENDGDYKCTVYLGNGSPLQSNSRSLRAQGCYMDCCCLRLFVCLFTLVYVLYIAYVHVCLHLVHNWCVSICIDCLFLCLLLIWVLISTSLFYSGSLC